MLGCVCSCEQAGEPRARGVGGGDWGDWGRNVTEAGVLVEALEGRHWKGQLKADAACVLRTLEDLPMGDKADAIAPLRDFVSNL